MFWALPQIGARLGGKGIWHNICNALALHVSPPPRHRGSTLSAIVALHIVCHGRIPPPNNPCTIGSRGLHSITNWTHQMVCKSVAKIASRYSSIFFIICVSKYVCMYVVLVCMFWYICGIGMYLLSAPSNWSRNGKKSQPPPSPPYTLPQALHH